MAIPQPKNYDKDAEDRTTASPMNGKDTREAEKVLAREKPKAKVGSNPDGMMSPQRLPSAAEHLRSMHNEKGSDWDKPKSIHARLGKG